MATGAAPNAPRHSLTRHALGAMARDKLFAACCVVLGVIVLGVIVGPWLSPHEYYAMDLDFREQPPQFAGQHWFGTDDLGRDLFVRTMQGGRISLMVGLVATIVSLVFGVVWGATAGYLGGRIDHLMMRVVDIFYAIPFMFFVILLMVLFGRNIILIFVAIGAVNWLDMARIVRGQTLALRGREFVQAAEVIGASRRRIIFRHIVPNLLGIVVVYATLTVPQVILIESFLSFLGLGVQEPMTSWGALVQQGTQAMSTAPWVLLFPATLLAVSLVCLNFIGDGLRDALDPKDRHR
ncbi:MAG: ABC transporter permease subunit [Pseudomonadota bacterium]